MRGDKEREKERKEKGEETRRVSMRVNIQGRFRLLIDVNCLMQSLSVFSLELITHAHTK